MDFHLSDELVAVQDLARSIFADRATTDRIREVEASETRVDERLWADLAGAGLVGIALPEEHGGAGLGLAGLCVLLEEQGRFVAPVPLWTAGVAALAVATHGDEEQRGRILPSAADGSLRLALALEEFAPAEPGAPACAATVDGNAWRLTGTKAVVPSPLGADAVLVSATMDRGPGLFLVQADAEGARWEQAETTTRDLSGHLHLDRAVGHAIGDPGGDALRQTLRRATAALAAIQAGVAQGALALAAGYLGERHQFGRPLATFQAVQHQLADCYIDIEAMRVTLWQALTSLADEAPGADAAVLVAKWWADQAGLDVVHRTQHVHGGIGVDVDYPAHRFFLWGKQISGTFGGAEAALADLGERLAVEEVAS
ncbi:acyl-CoA dehydrogenase family protein [Saccharopolyspora shandongensis]|uniref:acyl-CoA dehydrogenase family protein n=1 Tax=Saccharopolyspora shandongensis TaxID=418495 RepID=UPI0033DE38F3